MRKYIQDALRRIETLDKANFFDTYPGLGTERINFEDQYANYMDSVVEMIQEAAKCFFYKTNLLDPDIKVEFREKNKRRSSKPKEPCRLCQHHFQP